MECERQRLERSSLHLPNGGIRVPRSTTVPEEGDDGRREYQGRSRLLIKDSTACRGVLLEKLVVARLVNKFPSFHGPLKIMYVFTGAQHRALS